LVGVKTSVDNGEFFMCFRRNEDEIDVDEITACLNKKFYDIEEEIKYVASTVL